MTELGSHLSILLTRELATFERELELFPDDESLWKTLPGMPNSAGNLALHVAGNLQHFVGAVLGKTGYVRNRPAEFSRRSGTRAEVAAELQAAARAVQDVLPCLSNERFREFYPERLNDLTLRTDRFLMHLCAHAAYHLGQASTLRRLISRDNRSSGPVALAALQD